MGIARRRHRAAEELAAIERIGIRPGQKNVLLRLVIRHPTRTLTTDEASRNEEVAAAFPGVPAHLANSAGTLRFRRLTIDRTFQGFSTDPTYADAETVAVIKDLIELKRSNNYAIKDWLITLSGLLSETMDVLYWLALGVAVVTLVAVLVALLARVVAVVGAAVVVVVDVSSEGSSSGSLHIPKT